MFTEVWQLKPRFHGNTEKDASGFDDELLSGRIHARSEAECVLAFSVPVSQHFMYDVLRCSVRVKLKWYFLTRVTVITCWPWDCKLLLMSQVVFLEGQQRSISEILPL